MMKRYEKMLLCAGISSALAFGSSSFSYAAEPADYSFDQIVVTATKTPVKVSESNANISVITRQQIENHHYGNLAEALTNVPGVTVNLQGNGAGFSYSSALAINGSQQIVVLVDGVRANVNGSSYNVFPAGLMNNLDQIDRIEILKGAASTLYGSDAKGGVINIITRKADSDKTTLTITGGSNDKENYALYNEGKSGDYSWSLASQKDISGNFTDGHGNTIPAHEHATNNSFKVTKQLNDASNLTVSYSRFQDDNLRYNFSTTAAEAGLNNGRDNNTNWQVMYHYQFSPDSSNQLSLYQHHNEMWEFLNRPNSLWMMNMKTRGIQDQFTQKIGRDHVVTTGLDVYQDQIDYQDRTLSTPLHGKITDRAAYVQDEWNLSDQWKLTSGIRSDRHSIYGTHTTPSVNLGYKADDNTNYYLSYKEYFTSPNLFELYYKVPGGVILKPETGHTTEFGVNHRFDATTNVAAHIYETSSQDALAYNSQAGYYTNLDREVLHGWDIELAKQMSAAFSMNLGYSYMTFSYTSTLPGVHQPAMGFSHMPRGAWNIGLNYAENRYQASLTGHGTVGLPGNLPVNTYWIWDMATNYKITKDTKVFLKVNNLFNQYYAIYGDDTKIMNTYACPGRNYQFGLQYSF